MLYDHGYVASPNYPAKYFLDTDCRWRLAVQRRQSIRIILYDFELDVKRAGLCHEYLQISAALDDDTEHGCQLAFYRTTLYASAV